MCRAKNQLLYSWSMTPTVSSLLVIQVVVILYGVDIRTTSQHLYLMFDQQSSDMKKYLKQM